ncbi:MAG: hypothetical protein BMS9Abin08_0873 [Gammaproteobacteria bacterium]|nr:MAG: hypothetical protein BMS9Abin08_0873 [Gammaproteobacteria bacterium]
MGHSAVKLKNLVVITLIGAGVAYGGVKGYIYYKVKKQVDQLVAAARPFADIEYGSIGSDLQGRVVINELVVYPRGVNDAVKAEQLTVITPGLEFLLTGADSVKKGELPERMGIALTGARLNLKGRLTEMLEQAEAAQLGQQPAEDIACSLSSNFLTAQYRELGLDELIFDTRFTFERGLTASQLVFKMDYSIHDLEQAEFAMTLEGFGNSVMSLALASPKLKRVTMTYRPDAVFTRKILEHCAGKQGVDEQTFVNLLFEKSDEHYMQALGFVPGPGIRAAMKELMRNAGELSMVAQPPSTLDLKTVNLYRPKDWPDLFGLIVKVNGKEISDLSFTLPSAGFSQSDEQTAKFSLPGLGLFGQQKQATPVPAQTGKKSKVTRSSSGRLRYRIVARGDVNKLVGRDVRIATADGKRRSGRVLSITNGVISLEMRMHGGSLSTRVPVATASKIEVLERS